MKKYLKSIGVILGLIVLYQIVIFIASLGYSIAYGVYQGTIGGNVITEAAMKKQINDNLYTIVFIGEIIMVLGLVPTIKNKLIKNGDFKKLDLNTIIHMIILGIGMSGMVSIVSVTLSAIFPSYLEVSKSISDATGSYLQLFSIIIFGPIFEEIFFRGVIFGHLKKNYKIVSAVIVQALIFAIMHGNIVQGIYAFILGIVLGLVYIHYESLIACIIIHVVTNLFGSLVNSFIASKFDNIVIFGVVLSIISVICIIVPGMKIFKEYKLKIDKEISIKLN